MKSRDRVDRDRVESPDTGPRGGDPRVTPLEDVTAANRTTAAEQAHPVQPTAQHGPPKPTQLGRRSWWGVLRRTVREYRRDDLSDWAAALTYYGILSIFPGMLVLLSVLRLFGTATTHAVVQNVSGMAPGPARSILTSAARNLENGQSGTAGIIAIAGLVGALWSASGYVAAFMRASNAIYEVQEGRPFWKKIPIRLGVTVVTGVLLGISALAVVFTGRLAEQAGKLVGVGGGAVLAWNIAKWPVLVLIVSLVFALLYWAAPNARQSGFRWISPGGLLAVLLWIAASAGFAVYVANFGSYNKTYGALAGIIIFLVWLYISNTAVLLGAELDAELERGRAIAAGHPSDAEPYLEPRDTRKMSASQPGGDLA